MKKRIIILMVLLLTVLLAGAAQAAPFTFGDSVNYWPGWNNHTFDDHRDVIGAPNITGGTGEVDSLGNLTSLSISYSSYNYLITAGDLFINSNADSDWDYVLTNDGRIYSLAGVNSTISNTSLYTLSDSYNFYGDYRNGHPVTLNTSLQGLVQIGTYTLTNFNADTSTPVSFTNFSFFSSNDGLALGSEFILGFGATCANDVIYEKVQNPVPLPTTLMLFGSGIVGLAALRRRGWVK